MPDAVSLDAQTVVSPGDKLTVGSGSFKSQPDGGVILTAVD